MRVRSWLLCSIVRFMKTVITPHHQVPLFLQMHKTLARCAWSMPFAPYPETLPIPYSAGFFNAMDN